ncbi:hypothetical protein [Nonomuraea sp. CA-141351]|uniref:hypothetical protein n=1 Tax=Nonomuraea sp. CA-141351 TaxID=3239996 RepID=UPI003D940ECE
MLVSVLLVGALHAYQATYRQVVAQVVDEHAIVADVTWWDAAGVQQSGSVRTPLDRVSDTQTRIWLDPRGRPAPGPIGPVQIVFGFMLSAFSMSMGTRVALSWLRELRHRWIARKAVSELDRRWHHVVGKR